MALQLLTLWESELATITGHATFQWPHDWGQVRVAAANHTPENNLPRLDPAQHLLLTAGTPKSSPATRVSLGVLLAAGFGPEPAAEDLAEDARMRLCAVGLPQPLVDSWNRGLGLEPPKVLVPAAELAARRLLDTAFDGETPQPVPRVTFEPLKLATAVDLIASTLTVRASLRASGDLPLPASEPNFGKPTTTDAEERAA